MEADIFLQKKNMKRNMKKSPVRDDVPKKLNDNHSKSF